MLDLILRQIQRHKGALFIVFLSWIIGAYFIYTNHHRVFAYLSHFFSSPSLPQKENRAKAYGYIKKAQQRIQEEKVDLRIMEKSCKQIPIRYRGNIEQFRPDWLESLKNWKLESFTNLSEETIEKESKRETSLASIPGYWKAKHAFVLLSLRDAINAMQFAYEINTRSFKPDKEKGKLIIVPRIIGNYARALCKDHLAFLAWGEYFQFQERRAGRNELRGQKLYIEALRNYLGEGGARKGSSGHLHLGASIKAFCQKKRINLACIAPKESISIYQKLLKVERASRIPEIHFKISQSYLILAYQESNERRARRRRSQALVHLGLAAKSYDWEVEAHLGMTKIRLKQKEYQKALQNIRYLRLLRRQPGFPYREFSDLARQTLIGVGRPKHADCFAPLGKMLSRSQQSPCRELDL